MSALNTFSISLALKMILYRAHRRARFRHQVKGGAKWMVWGGMTSRGLTSLKSSYWPKFMTIEGKECDFYEKCTKRTFGAVRSKF